VRPLEDLPDRDRAARHPSEGTTGAADGVRRGPAAQATLDLAPAHFLFLLLGRSACTAGVPRCADCFLRRHCPAAGTGSTASGTAQ
jgi:hypothetical protein